MDDVIASKNTPTPESGSRKRDFAAIEEEEAPISNQKPKLAPIDLTESSCDICEKSHEPLIQCTGSCDRYYHLGCLKSSIQPQSPASCASWKCIECVITSQTVDTELSATLNHYSSKATTFYDAAVRGLGVLMYEATVDSGFDIHGVQLIRVFAYAAQIVGNTQFKDRLQSFAVKCGQKWMNANPINTFTDPSVRNIAVAIFGIYSLECIGRHHALKLRIRSYLQEKHLSAAEFFEWDPKLEVPGARASNDAQKYEQFTSALQLSFFADLLQLDIGCHYVHVVKHIETFRPYLGPTTIDQENGLSAVPFKQQVKAICTYLETMSEFGALKLSKKLFLEEYEFLVNAKYVDYLREHEPYLKVRVTTCIQFFGDVEFSPKETQDWLLSQQSEFGCFGEASGTHIGKVQMTILAVRNLLGVRPCGYGPRIVAAKPLLETWARKQREDQVPSSKFMITSHGLRLVHYEQSLYDRIRDTYTAAMKVQNENVSVMYTRLRLQQVIKWKEQQQKNQLISRSGAPVAVKGKTNPEAFGVPEAAWCSSPVVLLELTKRPEDYIDSTPPPLDTTLVEEDSGDKDVVSNGSTEEEPESLQVVLEDGSIGYVVEKLADRRLVQGRVQFYIKWKGYPEEENTWEPMEYLVNCDDLVAEYNLRHPVM